jgi:hypothetical protein
MRSLPASRSARSLLRTLEAASFALGVVGFATGPFARDAAVDTLLYVPAAQAAQFVLLFQLVPALAVFAADRVVARVRPAAVGRWRALLGSAVLVLLAVHVADVVVGVLSETRASLLLRAAVGGLAAWAVVLLVLLGTRARSQWQHYTTRFFVIIGPPSVFFAISLLQQLYTPAAPISGASTRPALPAADVPPVYVLVFDELSAAALVDESGAVDAARFPHLAAFAGDSVVFTRATTNYFRTWYAVPAIIDAVAPLAGEAEVRLYLQHQRLEEVFADDCGSRFTCHGIAAHVQADPDRLAYHMLTTASLASVPRPLRGLAARALAPAARALGVPEAVADRDAVHLYHDVHVKTFLDGIDRTSARGTVSVFHTMVSHFPYAFTPAGTPHRYRPDRAVGQDPESATLWDNYRSQLQYADAVFGQFVARLRDQGLYDEAVIVVTADHGLRPDIPPPDWSGQLPIHSFVPHVPLLIRAPGLTPGVSAADYQHIDLGPTLHDLIPRLDDPTWTGRSAFAVDRPARARWFAAEGWLYRSDDRADTWAPVRLLDAATLPLAAPPADISSRRE